MTKTKVHESTKTQVRAIAHAHQKGEEALRQRAETIGELKDRITELEKEISKLKSRLNPPRVCGPWPNIPDVLVEADPDPSCSEGLPEDLSD